MLPIQSGRERGGKIGLENIGKKAITSRSRKMYSKGLLTLKHGGCYLRKKYACAGGRKKGGEKEKKKARRPSLP